jgi:hypothetical protein
MLSPSRLEDSMIRSCCSALLLALTIAVIAAVGCSSSKPAASDAAAPAASAAGQPATGQPAASPAPSGEKTDKGFPHPCTLLTPALAESVYGAGATIERNSIDDCMIKSPKPTGGVLSVKIEELDATTWDGGEMMKKFDKTVETIPGLGEGAYSYMGGSIIFRKGKAEISVITSAYDGPMPKLDAAKLVAGKVAGAM